MFYVWDDTRSDLPIQAVAFRRGMDLEQLYKGTVDLIATPQINVWQNMKNVQLVVKDFCLHESSPSQMGDLDCTNKLREPLTAFDLEAIRQAADPVWLTQIYKWLCAVLPDGSGVWELDLAYEACATAMTKIGSLNADAFVLVLRIYEEAGLLGLYLKDHVEYRIMSVVLIAVNTRIQLKETSLLKAIQSRLDRGVTDIDR